MALILHIVVGPSSSWVDPSNAEIAAGQLSGGGAATWHNGGVTWTGGGQTGDATGLTAGTAYKAAAVVYDNVGATYSNVAVSAAWTQLATGNAPLSLGYSIRSAGSVTLGAGYSVRSAGLSDLPVGYSINSAGNAVLAAGYGIGGSGFATLALGYRVESGSGSGATAAEIWSYTLSNGLTAAQNVVEIHTKLSELHLIHGLTAGSPLSVTAASRAAGAVSQAVAEAAGTVTVTRQ